MNDTYHLEDEVHHLPPRMLDAHNLEDVVDPLPKMLPPSRS